MIHTGKNCVFDDLGLGCVLIVYGKMPPAEQEFSALMNFMSKLEFSSVRLLGITDGGMPTAKQRQVQVETFGDTLKDVPTALISGRFTTRLLTMIVGSVMQNLRPFEPTELNAALEFLGVGAGAHQAIRDRLTFIGSQVPPGNFRTFDAVIGRR